MGSALTSLRELIFSDYKLSLFNKKKSKRLLLIDENVTNNSLYRTINYNSSGALAIDKLVELNENVTDIASGYSFRFTANNFPTTKNNVPKGKIKIPDEKKFL